MSTLNEPPTGHELNRAKNPAMTDAQRARLESLTAQRRDLFNQFCAATEAKREKLQQEGKKVQQQLDNLAREICAQNYLPFKQRQYKDWHDLLKDGKSSGRDLFGAFH